MGWFGGDAERCFVFVPAAHGMGCLSCGDSCVYIWLYGRSGSLSLLFEEEIARYAARGLWYCACVCKGGKAVCSGVDRSR
jgi:hypothetical protein